MSGERTIGLNEDQLRVQLAKVRAENDVMRTHSRQANERVQRMQDALDEQRDRHQKELWAHAEQESAMRALALANQQQRCLVVYNFGVDMRYVCDCLDSIARM